MSAAQPRAPDDFIDWPEAPPSLQPPALNARACAIERRIDFLALAFFGVFAAFSTAQVLESSLNGPAGLACLLSIYASFAFSAAAAPYIIARSGVSSTTAMAASAAPYVFLVFLYMLPARIEALTQLACVGVGLGAGPLWAAHGTFVGEASVAFAAATGMTVSLAASRLNARFYSIFFCSGIVSNSAASFLLISITDAATALRALFALLTAVAGAGALSLTLLAAPDDTGDRVFATRAARKGAGLAAGGDAEVAASAGTAGDGSVTEAGGDKVAGVVGSAGSGAAAVAASGNKNAAAATVGSVVDDAASTAVAVATAAPAPPPTPLAVFAFAFRDPRMLLLLPVAMSAGAGAGFIFGAWMASAVAAQVGAGYVGLAGAVYGIAGVGGMRAWAALAAQPAWGRRWVFVGGFVVCAAWYAGTAIVFAGTAPDAAAPRATPARVAAAYAAVAVFAAVDPVFNAMTSATAQTFFPVRPALTCSIAGLKIAYCVGFAAQQLFALALRLSTGAPCLGVQALVLLGLLIGAGAALGYMHARVAHIDGGSLRAEAL